MIIKLTLENWMSFKDRISFSMLATREKQHNERLPMVNKYKTKVLPISAIYGGNASGKTNFFRAINFAKQLIIRGTGPDALIAVIPFRLDTSSQEKPSYFSFEILVEEEIYELSFEVTRKKIVSEKLILIGSTSQKILYERHDNKIVFDKSLIKDEFLQFAFKGTRENQLFLTNTVSQKVEHFRPIYNWFKDTLELIAPDTRFEPFEHFFNEVHPLYHTMNDFLSKLDTGISRLGSEEISFENLAIPQVLKMGLQESVKEGDSVKVSYEDERFIIQRRKNGELSAQKLVTLHPHSSGQDIKFDLREESDGSRRIIDLLPAFLELSSPLSKKVFIIDEIDRSLHTLLTRKLLEFYLEKSSPEGRSQILLTTHDALLMDQNLLRRDEMWIAERNVQGASSLISFSEFKDVRNDKDIRKSYLQGRLGGIPNVAF